MASFDMRGQQVNQQYNAGRDMNIGSIHASGDFLVELEQLHTQVAQAREAGTLPEETATDVQYQLTKAVQQAKKPEPDKKVITDHLITAKGLMEGVTTAGGMVTALLGVIEMASKFFS